MDSSWKTTNSSYWAIAPALWNYTERNKQNKTHSRDNLSCLWNSLLFLLLLLYCHGPIRPNFSPLLTTLPAWWLAGGRAPLLLWECFQQKFLQCNGFPGLEECGYQLISSGSRGKTGREWQSRGMIQMSGRSSITAGQGCNVIYHSLPQNLRSCLLPFSWAALQKAAAAPWQLLRANPAFLSPDATAGGVSYLDFLRWTDAIG